MLNVTLQVREGLLTLVGPPPMGKGYIRWYGAPKRRDGLSQTAADLCYQMLLPVEIRQSHHMSCI